MDRKKIIVIISSLVIIISIICSILPLITSSELAEKAVISTFGEEVILYGKGLYARNSVSSAVQAIAQDMVTLFLIVPGMITALLMIRKEKMIGKFLLTGLFGYMLYTYMSYAFLMFYNDLFLLYVANMTLSFYGFVLCVMMLLDDIKIERLKSDMPTKGMSIFLLISGVMIFFMWIGRIVPTIGNDTAPVGLDNCTTLVIQAMDMGIIVPACFVIAYLLKIKHKLGYILGPVIIVKAVTLVTAVLTMAIYMKISGVEVDAASFIIFGPICIASYIFFFLIMKKIANTPKVKIGRDL